MSMFQNVLLGQYIPGQSFLHQVDPRTKLVLYAVYAVLIFLASSWADFAILGGLLVTGLVNARISLRTIWEGLRLLWLFLLLTAVIQLMVVKGGDVYLSWGGITVEEEGVLQAVLVTGRLMLLLIGSSLLTLTTSPMQLTDGLERLLSPLARLGVSVHELSLMMSIALRFIPTLFDEIEKITNAQKSRGASIDTGPVWLRLKHMMAVMIPLMVSAMRRADELAWAMEARGYRGAEGRTSLRTLQFTWRDVVMLISFLGTTALVGWWV